MKYAYVAYDQSGALIRGAVDASDTNAARDQLASQGLYVTELSAQGESSRGAVKAPKFARMFRQGKDLSNIVEFARHMSILVGTGTPLADALGALERQSVDEEWKAKIRGLSDQVERGSSLSEAMGAAPESFDAVCRSLVAAGEASGELPAMLGRLSSVVRQRQVTWNALTGAAAYPAILMGVASIVIGIMMFVVVPRFAEMFASLGAPLPPTTVMLVGISSLVRGWWWLILPGVAGALFGAVWWLRTPAGRKMVDRAVVRAPITGKLARSIAGARLSRLLGSLLDAKLPLLESLDLVRASMTNSLFSDLLERAKDEVSGGGDLATPFKQSDLITPTVAEAIRSGEMTGRLGAVLSDLADHMDDDNAMTIRSITTLIEPIILILMGVVVGFVAISMFLPLFDLTAATGG